MLGKDSLTKIVNTIIRSIIKNRDKEKVGHHASKFGHPKHYTKIYYNGTSKM